jgi:hypothetical protein
MLRRKNAPCYVITHLFEQFSLGEIRILSLRDQRFSELCWLVVAILLYQDNSTDLPFTIDRLSPWKIASSHKPLIAMTTKHNGQSGKNPFSFPVSQRGCSLKQEKLRFHLCTGNSLDCKNRNEW